VKILHGPRDVLARWVIEGSGGIFTPGTASAIVVGRDGKPAAGIAFTDYNGRNISAHIFIPDKSATLLLLELAGSYVFDQLKCTRLTLIADASNLGAVRLHEKLGAVREGCLVGAGRNGDDILVSRLTPDARIWRKLRERLHRTALVPALPEKEHC
jgi:RimJ/RimL family protein N-acetyltransferase